MTGGSRVTVHSCRLTVDGGRSGQRAVNCQPSTVNRRRAARLQSARTEVSMKLAFRALPIILLPMLLVGCGSSGPLAATGASVSLDQEWQLGNQMAAQVEQQVRL